jgi:hypothetical protein
MTPEARSATGEAACVTGEPIESWRRRRRIADNAGLAPVPHPLKPIWNP